MLLSLFLIPFHIHVALSYPILILVILPLLLALHPLLLLLCPYCLHIFIIVPHRSPLLLFLCSYIIIVRSDLVILWPLRLLYIDRRFFHLYHPRIVHLCNVKEVSPSKRLISKSLIYLFYLFVSWFHNIWYQSLDSRVSLLQIGHHGIITILVFMWSFRLWN